MMLTTRASLKRFSVRQAFLLTNLAWLVIVVFGALPFQFSELKLDPVDALFESVSGVTTTGATVIVGLDFAPPGILLWRAILQWLGGIGIIVMAVDRKSVVSGKSVSVRVALGGRGIIKKTKLIQQM